MNIRFFLSVWWFLRRINFHEQSIDIFLSYLLYFIHLEMYCLICWKRGLGSLIVVKDCMSILSFLQILESLLLFFTILSIFFLKNRLRDISTLFSCELSDPATICPNSIVKWKCASSSSVLMCWWISGSFC